MRLDAMPCRRRRAGAVSRTAIFVLGFVGAVLLMAGIIGGLLAGGVLNMGTPRPEIVTQSPPAPPSPPPPSTTDAATTAPPTAAPPTTPAERAAYTGSGPRSPLVQPGERLERPLPARRVAGADDADTPAVIVPVGDAPAAGEVVPWDRAAGHVGRTITVRGPIVRAKPQRGVTLLNFDNDWRGKFYLAVYDSAAEHLPAPAQTFYVGKTVEVTGEVEVYQPGKPPQIQVRRAEQIRVVEP